LQQHAQLKEGNGVHLDSTIVVSIMFDEITPQKWGRMKYGHIRKWILWTQRTYWAANSLVGVRISTLIAGTRFGRKSRRSKTGKEKAAV